MKDAPIICFLELSHREDTDKSFTLSFRRLVSGAGVLCWPAAQTCYLLKDILSEIVLHLSRALAHVIRHPASEHTDDIGLGQHYENIQTRVTVNSLRKYPNYPELAEVAEVKKVS